MPPARSLLAQEKAALRRAVRDRVLALDPEARRAEEAALADRFAALPGLAGAGTVLVYAGALADEIDTRPLARILLDRGQRLIYPRVDRPARRLRLFAVADPDRDLVPGALNIPEPGPGCREAEPGEVDWVLVPGVAFDARGYRLGRGAGYYDRLLPRLRPDVPRWALILAAQWVGRVPTEAHDQPVDGVADAGRALAINDRGRAWPGARPG